MSVGNNEIGELLIDLGLITTEQLADAVKEQEESGDRLTLVLSRLGLITERQLKDALELQYGVNFINLSSNPPEEEFVRMVAEDVLRKYRFVPVSKSGAQFTVAMVDPDDLIAADAVRQNLQSGNFKKLVCTADDFNHLMYLVYEGGAAILEEAKRAAEAAEEAAAEPAGKIEEAQEEVVAPAAELIEDLEEVTAPSKKSKAKKRTAMRNLFSSDDDDLDSMFGDSDQAEADDKKSKPAKPVAEESEPVAEPAAKAKNKSARKSFTSLFDEDDDEDFGSTAGKEPENSIAEEPENPVADEPELPTNNLLEHILEEAEAKEPEPVKAKKKKKSFSLFDDEAEDMDLDTTEEEVSAAPVEALEPEIAEPELEIAEPELEIAQAPEPEIEEEVEEPAAKSHSKTSKSKKLRSLFDDEMEEDDLFGEQESKPVVTEEKRTPKADLFADDDDDDDVATQDASPGDLLGDEQDSDAESDTIDSAESLMKAIEKPFQSLFDDDMDEDDLFGSKEAEPEPVVEEEEPPQAVEVEDEPDEDEDEPQSKSGKKSNKGRAIQSLFEDEMDEDSLFAVSDEPETAAPEPVAEEEPSIDDELEDRFQNLLPEESMEIELVPQFEPELQTEEAEEQEEDFGTMGAGLLTEPEAEAQLPEPELELPEPEPELEIEEEPFVIKGKLKRSGPDLVNLLSRFESEEEEEQEEQQEEVAPAAPIEEEVEEEEPVLEERPPIDALIAALDDHMPDDKFSISVTGRGGTVEAPPPADSDESEPEESGDFASMDKLGYGKEETFAESGDWASITKPDLQANAEGDEEGLYGGGGMFNSLASLTEDADEFAFEKEEPVKEAAPKSEPGSKARLRALLDSTEPVSEEDDSEDEADSDAVPDLAELTEVLAELSERYKDEETVAEVQPAEEYESLEEALEDTGFQPVISESESLLAVDEEPLYGADSDDKPPLDMIDEALPLDRENLQEPSTATSELPPYVVSRTAKTLSSGVHPVLEEPQELSPAANVPVPEEFDHIPESINNVPEPQTEPVEPPAVAAQIEPELAAPPPVAPVQPARAVEPQSYGELQTGLPGSDFTHTGIQRQLAEIVEAMPEEVPDGLDDVLASVTNEIIDSVDLTQLPGSRAEISFLEEIVESELSMPEEARKATEPFVAAQPVQAPAAAVDLEQTISPSQAAAAMSASQSLSPQAVPAAQPPAETPAPVAAQVPTPVPTAPVRTSQPTPFVADPANAYVHQQLQVEAQASQPALQAAPVETVPAAEPAQPASGPKPYVPQPYVASTPAVAPPAVATPVVQEPPPQVVQPVPAAEPVAQQPVPQPVEPAPVPQPVAQEPVPQPVQPTPQPEPPAAAPAPALDESILALTAQILTQAVNSGCSEIHFEPVDGGIALRFMAAGELVDETTLPREIQAMLILCLKSMAGLDITTSDRPQDTKFTTDSFGAPVEMRVTSIPGVHGEMVAVSLKG